MNCVFFDNVLRPGTCPLSEYEVFLNTILNIYYKTLLCLFVISGKQEPTLRKHFHILMEDVDKVLTSWAQSRQFLRA